ncbi:ACP S-malonyltransferase [Ruegeria sp. 2012CJ41-6]|uniref:[acyl-carrier-protein] S-malonyltransferase n=1 Tax=Ruegeria spongiae TaxID=2942209 RepID=A0ABT0Q0I1_9RHOB|nr:ACP S-malonyltransferase [Ruegeria spongiae]MCL6282703.1 ACP S-malonyltransferase [Ruegeria spongiae]
MKQTAIVIAPGRGTYNREELGYLTRYHGNKSALIDAFDTYRRAQGQPPLSELDTAARFSGAVHTRGDNASALIHACAYCDFLSIDRDKFEILGVTGNSMGWYIALTCAGALNPMNGLRVVNTMGTLMQEQMIGGQVIYPFMDSNWQVIPGAREKTLAKVSQIAARPDHALDLSIDLGGMLVLAGNAAGLAAFEVEIPQLQDRFPMRLPNHAGFHTALQATVAKLGQSQLDQCLFDQPQLPLIDGRGAIWRPKSSDLAALRDYTLDHQVTKTYDFTTAIRTAAREFMPDVFIILGPGATLGGAVAQSLILSHWRGWFGKASVQTSEPPRLLSMGRADQRDLILG